MGAVDSGECRAGDRVDLIETASEHADETGTGGRELTREVNTMEGSSGVVCGTATVDSNKEVVCRPDTVKCSSEVVGGTDMVKGSDNAMAGTHKARKAECATVAVRPVRPESGTGKAIKL